MTANTSLRIHDDRILASDTWQVKIDDIRRIWITDARASGPIPRVATIHIELGCGAVNTVQHTPDAWYVAGQALGRAARPRTPV